MRDMFGKYMNLTKNQKKELDVLYYFSKHIKKQDLSDVDYISYFDFSERGIKPANESSGYKYLNECKRWVEIHMRMYEDGIIDGTVPYYTLLGGEEGDEVPTRVIVDFLKKALFRGMDSKLIEKLYGEICGEKNITYHERY